MRAPDWAVQPAPVETRTIDVHLAPWRDERGEVDRIDVAIGFSEPPGELGDPSPFVLQLAQVDGGGADHVLDLYARDADGALALRPVATTAGAGKGAWASWRAERRPVGPIKVGYRVKIEPATPDHFDGTRAAAGGFQGTGATLLLLPDAAGAFTVRLAWELAGAGEGAAAVSSLGQGAVVTTTVAGLRDALFMAGPIGQIAVDAGGARLDGAWLGRPAFDPIEAIPWAMRAHAAERASFHGGEEGGSSFSFFVRVVPRPDAAWVLGARGSGMLLLPGSQLRFTRALRFAIAAELVRRDLGGEGAPVLLAGGFATHAARWVLLRAGLATVDEIEGDVRDHAAAPASLYAAEVDAAVRARSGGKRSADDVVRAVAERARALGAAPPAEAWREVIGAELGPDGQARFDAVVKRGEPAAPPVDAYGPCFKGVARGKDKPIVWTRDPKVPDAQCAR